MVLAEFISVEVFVSPLSPQHVEIAVNTSAILHRLMTTVRIEVERIVNTFVTHCTFASMETTFKAEVQMDVSWYAMMDRMVITIRAKW